MAEKARRSQVDLLTDILQVLNRIDARLVEQPRDDEAPANSLGDLSAAYRRPKAVVR